MSIRAFVGCTVTLTMLACTVSADRASEAESVEVKIARAMTAAPAMVSAEATIVDDDGTVLREGSNGWVCAPNVYPDDGYPICADEVWQAWIQAFKAGSEEFTADGFGVSYMLKGDGGVSNSDPFHPNPSEAADFIQEGAHLMIILPVELLENVTDDPFAGGPYVMWRGTPYVHLMVPLEERGTDTDPEAGVPQSGG